MTYTDSADDDQAWTAQDERDNPPAPPPPPEEDTGPEPLWKQFAREHLGYGAPPPDPGTEPSPPDSRPLYRQFSDKYLGAAADPAAAAPAADDSSKRTPLYQQWAEKHLGPIKDAIASYLGGDNAAPPHEVDAALAATQAANPGASTADVVQKTIAGPDPLSPGYMDQAGQDALGGLGRPATAGQAPAQQPAQTGYAQSTYTGPQGEQRTGPNMLTVPPKITSDTKYVPPAAGAAPYESGPGSKYGLPLRPTSALTQQELINAQNAPDRDISRDPELLKFFPPGYFDTLGGRAALERAFKNNASYNPPRLDPPRTDAERRNLAEYMTSLYNNDRGEGSPNSSLASTTDQETGRVTYPNTAVGRAAQAADQARARGENPMYDVDDIRRGTPLNMPQATPPSSRSAPARAPAARTPAARGRRSDAGDDTGAPPGPQYAIADSGTMSDASNDVRSTLPAAPQGVGYAQANQPPSAGGFSGAAGNNVTTIPVRQGAPTPAGAAPAPAGAVPAPRGPTNEDFTRDVAEGRAGMKNAATPYTPRTDAGGGGANPTYPRGYKLVPAAPAQGTVSDYDRAVVGPDGKVVNYVRKGDTPPSSDVVMNKVYSDNLNNNMQEFYRRLHAGEPTGIDLNQYKQGNYDLSQPLPPRQAPTAQSMADRDEAVRQNIIHAPAQGGGNDPVQDLLQRAAQTRDPNAQRMFTNEAYKIQETRRVNQQKSADAALKTFSTGEQNLIKSIYTKENAGNTLTDAEQALKDDYVTRIQQHSRSQQGGGQAQAGGQATGGRQPIQVHSMADAARLPRGTQFLDPNGNLRTVP